jgi:hypothetical protein
MGVRNYLGVIYQTLRTPPRLSVAHQVVAGA